MPEPLILIESPSLQQVLLEEMHKLSLDDVVSVQCKSGTVFNRMRVGETDHDCVLTLERSDLTGRRTDINWVKLHVDVIESIVRHSIV